MYKIFWVMIDKVVELLIVEGIVELFDGNWLLVFVDIL